VCGLGTHFRTPVTSPFSRAARASLTTRPSIAPQWAKATPLAINTRPSVPTSPILPDIIFRAFICILPRGLSWPHPGACGPVLNRSSKQRPRPLRLPRHIKIAVAHMPQYGRGLDQPQEHHHAPGSTFRPKHGRRSQSHQAPAGIFLPATSERRRFRRPTPASPRRRRSSGPFPRFPPRLPLARGPRGRPRALTSPFWFLRNNRATFAESDYRPADRKTVSLVWRRVRRKSNGGKGL